MAKVQRKRYTFIHLNMKFTAGITLLLAVSSVHGFAPSSSFTSFRGQSASGVNTLESTKTNALALQSKSRNANRKGTEMNMMFESLATAIGDVAKNIGGRQRCVMI